MGERSGRTSPRVAVLMGGASAERDVSLSSGRECASALRGEGFDVIEVDAGPDLAERLSDIQPDVCFNALHGRWGEDGCVQGLLEWLRLPYTHSGVLASSLAMDKERSKAAFRVAGLPVAESREATRAEIEAAHVLSPPYVVKPVADGSSVGVYIVDAAANGPPKLDDGLPARLMVETYVPGRELTVSVLDDRPLAVTEIFTDGWYDYHAKYAPGGSRHVIPAEIPDEITEACLGMALTAHRALGCRGVTRTDYRWDDSRGLDGLIVLELNTQPGMTPTSLTPEHAQHAGLSFGALCRWIVEDASCDR
ncbi:D-alanine--D-alanine ligase [Rhodobacterales bacterium HKCCE3408]|nr:D-alanine--D-alanine ligase [Rhodobacterales bacterium HKCCE3408]